MTLTLKGLKKSQQRKGMPATATTTTLVLVESPAKCKTIESYLGDGFRCLASLRPRLGENMGHARQAGEDQNLSNGDRMDQEEPSS